MLTHAGRSVLNKALSSIINQNQTTPKVLERLVEDFHEHPLLVPYQIINHDRFEDLFWGVIKIIDVRTQQSPR